LGLNFVFGEKENDLQTQIIHRRVSASGGQRRRQLKTKIILLQSV